MINKIKNKFFNKQFLSFGLIGAFNTVGSLLIYMTSVIFGISVSLSSLLGDVITMIISYFLNMKFTYHTKFSLKTFIIFPISYIPGFILNMVITVLIVDLLNAPELYAKAFSLPITIPLNFIVMSYVIKMTKKEN